MISDVQPDVEIIARARRKKKQPENFSLQFFE
jgi:hypothetical protein